VKLERLNDEIFAIWITVDDLFLGDVFENVVTGEKLVSYVANQLGEVSLSFGTIMLDPLDHSLKDVFLGKNAELVTRNQLYNRVEGESYELFRRTHLREVFSGVSLCLAQQISTRMQVSETYDAEDVCRVELLAQEIAARVTDFRQLQKVGSWEKILNVVFAHFDAAHVHEPDE
jgi:hypothetical protein